MINTVAQSLDTSVLQPPMITVDYDRSISLFNNWPELEIVEQPQLNGVQVFNPVTQLRHLPITGRAHHRMTLAQVLSNFYFFDGTFKRKVPLVKENLETHKQVIDELLTNPQVHAAGAVGYQSTGMLEFDPSKVQYRIPDARFLEALIEQSLGRGFWGGSYKSWSGVRALFPTTILKDQANRDIVLPYLYNHRGWWHVGHVNLNRVIGNQPLYTLAIVLDEPVNS